MEDISHIAIMTVVTVISRKNRMSKIILEMK